MALSNLSASAICAQVGSQPFHLFVKRFAAVSDSEMTRELQLRASSNWASFLSRRGSLIWMEDMVCCLLRETSGRLRPCWAACFQ